MANIFSSKPIVGLAFRPPATLCFSSRSAWLKGSTSSELDRYTPGSHTPRSEGNGGGNKPNPWKWIAVGALGGLLATVAIASCGKEEESGVKKSEVRKSKGFVDEESELSKMWTAIDSGNVNELRAVINAGGEKYINAIFKVKGRHGLTPLAAATAKGNYEMVDTLLKMEKTRVDYRNEKPPRTVVITDGDKVYDVTNSTFSPYNGQTALMIAAAKGYMRIAQLLIKNRAILNRKVEEGFPHQYYTALNFAIEAGHYHMVNFLIKNGADVNDRTPDAPLMHAVHKGNLNIAALLIKRGAKINATNTSGITALNVACVKGYEPIVEHLLSKGARESVNVAESKYGTTPLMSAAANGRLGVVKILVKNGASIDAKNKDGETALRHAVTGGHLEVIKYLVSKGADVNAQTNNGCSPFTKAVIMGKEEITAYLLSKGGQPNIQWKKGVNYSTPRCTTPIHVATNTTAKIVKMLLDHGADPNAIEDKLKITPLMRLSWINKSYDFSWSTSSDPKLRKKWDDLESERIAMARELLKRGADVEAKTEPFRGKRMTAIDMAIKSRFLKLASFLKKYKASRKPAAGSK